MTMNNKYKKAMDLKPKDTIYGFDTLNNVTAYEVIDVDICDETVKIVTIDEYDANETIYTSLNDNGKESSYIGGEGLFFSKEIIIDFMEQAKRHIDIELEKLQKQ